MDQDSFKKITDPKTSLLAIATAMVAHCRGIRTKITCAVESSPDEMGGNIMIYRGKSLLYKIHGKTPLDACRKLLDEVITNENPKHPRSECEICKALLLWTAKEIMAVKISEIAMKSVKNGTDDIHSNCKEEKKSSERLECTSCPARGQCTEMNNEPASKKLETLN